MESIELLKKRIEAKQKEIEDIESELRELHEKEKHEIDSFIISHRSHLERKFKACKMEKKTLERELNLILSRKIKETRQVEGLGKLFPQDQ